MNKLLLAFAVIILSSSCHSNESTQSASTDSTLNKKDDSTTKVVYQEQKIDTCVLGDINKDGIVDSAFIQTPTLKITDASDFGCANDSCFVTIKFSNKLPDLIHSNAIHGLVFATADINEDGISEIVYAPDWFSSCWSGLFIYTVSKNEWKKIGEGSYYSCNEDADLTKRIKKVKKNGFTIFNDEMNDDGKMKKKAQTITLE